jgi:hypothetical protein
VVMTKLGKAAKCAVISPWCQVHTTIWLTLITQNVAMYCFTVLFELLCVCSPQAILLADILPTLCIKSVAPFFIQQISYRSGIFHRCVSKKEKY